MTVPDTTTPMTSPSSATSPTSPTSPGWNDPAPGPAKPGASPTQQIARVLNAPVAVARQVLPTSPVPVVLATGALLLAGVVELPVAGALGLGYLALRSWRTHP